MAGIVNRGLRCINEMGVAAFRDTDLNGKLMPGRVSIEPTKEGAHSRCRRIKYARFVAVRASFRVPKNLKGEIALSRGDTSQAISYLEEGTDWLRTIGEAIFLPASESLANAYEQQLLLYRVRLEPVVIYWDRNQLRLAQLYRKLGRVKDARRIQRELLGQLAYADSDHPILLQSKDAEKFAVNR